MARTMGSKNKKTVEKDESTTEQNCDLAKTDDGAVGFEELVKEDPLLPNKSLFRIDEVADYFSVSERCIRLWIDHGHLERAKIVGVIRVPRESILRCRFR